MLGAGGGARAEDAALRMPLGGGMPQGGGMMGGGMVQGGGMMGGGMAQEAG